MVWLLPTKLSQ